MLFPPFSLSLLLPLPLITLLIHHPLQIVAQGSEGQFFMPPAATAATTWDFSGNEVWSVDTTHTISWESYYENYTIAAWHLSDDDIAKVTRGSRSANIFELYGPAQASEFNWPVSSFNFNLSNSPVFYLALANNTSTDLDNTIDGASFISHWFNITSSPSSSSSSGPTNTPTSTTGIISNGTGNGNGTANANNASTHQSGNPNTPLILGIVLGLSFAFVGGAALHFYLRRRRHSSSKPSPTLPSASTPLNPETETTTGEKYPGELTDEEAVHSPRELASPEQLWGGWVKGEHGGLEKGVGVRQLQSRNKEWRVSHEGDIDKEGKDGNREGEGERRGLIEPAELEG